MYYQDNSTDTRILLIDDNSPFVLPIVRCFAMYPKIIIHVLVLMNNSFCSYKNSKHIKSIIKRADFQYSDFFNITKAAIQDTNANFLIPVREWITELVNQNISEIEKIVKTQLSPSNDILKIVRNKFYLNEWLKAKGFPYATVKLVKLNAIKKITTDKFNFPVLLKPCYGIGGKGIEYIEDHEILVQKLMNKDIYCDNYIIQEFIKGYDIDISAFCINGIIKFYTIQKGIILRRFSYSKGIEFLKNEELLFLAKRIFYKMNYTGIAHLDFRYNSIHKTYILIDFNARYWSTLLASMSVGINFPMLALMATKNIELISQNYETRNYYLGMTAIVTFLRNILKKKYNIKFKYTQFKYVLKDPLPEISNFFHLLLSVFKKKLV